MGLYCFFFNDTATTEIYTLSLHDALPILRDQPDAVQPRYLLGLCYFFADRWADATATLEPLWAQESEQLPYLYVLSNAAHRASRKDLDDRAATQLIKIGGGSPEYHLFAGKYHLNLRQYDPPLTQFPPAAQR